MADPAAEMIAWDVHAHLVPFKPEELASVDGVEAIDGKLEIDGHLLDVGRLFEPPELVDWMAENRIGRALVSAPPPTYRPQLGEEAARQWARYINQGLFEICARFVGTLDPMPHLAIRYPNVAADTVDAASKSSVNRFSLPAGASGDLVLSDPAFDSLWSRLADCNAFVFIHPAACCDGRLSAFYLENLLGNPYETSVAAAHLLFGGVLERYPSITFCLAHGGGNLATLAGRWQRGFETGRPGIDTSQQPPTDLVRRFCVDCILHNGAAVELAAQLFGDTKVLFGSDWPFPMGLDEPHAQLASVDPTLRRRILGENAAAIVGP